MSEIQAALLMMADDGIRMVRCPSCRKLWFWEPDLAPEYAPTAKGLCTCLLCRAAMPEHSGNHGKQRPATGDENPLLENGVRALEDQ